MDYDDVQSDDDDQQQRPHNDLIDDVPDFPDEEDEDGNWRQEQSSVSKGKGRKRLVKKADGGSSAPAEFNDFADEEDGETGYGSMPEDDSASRKRKNKGLMKEGPGGERKRKEKKLRKDNFSDGGRDHHHKGKLSLRRKKGSGDEGDPEMKEMWDTIAGGDSEVRIAEISLLFSYCHFPYGPVVGVEFF